MTQLLFIFLILLSLLLGYLADKTQKTIYLYSLIALITFVAGFRGQSCGVDTQSYYDSISRGFPFSWMFREEGFRLVANFFMEVYNNPQLTFIFCAFVTNMFILLRLWDFRKEANFSFMNLLYLFIFYSNTMNIMRQFVAVALIFYGTRFLKKRKLLFIPFLIVAFYFHRSSLLSVGYFIISLWNNFSKKQKQLFIAPLLLLIVLVTGYVSAYLASDIESYYSQIVNNNNITYFYLLSITIIVLICEKTKLGIKITNNEIKRFDKNYKIDNSIIIYILIGLAFSSLSMYFAFVGRTALYYSVYNIVFWGIASRKFKNAQFNKILIFIYAIYLFGLVIFRNDALIFPYEVYIF